MTVSDKPVTENTSPQASMHPLDPITAAEVDTARHALTDAGMVGPNTRFAWVQLKEPHKREVIDSSATPQRELAIVLLNISIGEVEEVVVDTGSATIVSSARVPTDEPPYGQPAIIMEDFERIDDVVKKDQRWLAAISAREIDDLDTLVILPLAPGYFGFEDEKGRRIMRALTLYRAHPADSPWAHPVEGLIAYVDLTSATVLSVYDYGVVPMPPEPGNFREGDRGAVRGDLKPLEIVQPEGPSFTVEGRVVEWQNWSFRVGFDQREGLVLHQVSFHDGDQFRPIMHRASIAEMVVPYGDPSPMRFWISYFDSGEYGLGKLATSLRNGCDCLGEIYYFDAVLADDNGRPYTAKNVVCLHEEDYGVLWKHSEIFNNMHDETRRSRRLVISFWTAIGNYDYGFFWCFYQDGTIQLEVKLTGILFANAQSEGVANPHASQVAPDLVAPYHQHLFCARLDMAVDGTENTVEENDVVRMAMSENNKYGNAFTIQSRILDRESIAGRMVDPLHSRTWTVKNPTRTNRLGQSSGYKLVPQAGPVLLAAEGSTVRDRATFATKHLWVTQYDPAQRYAGVSTPTSTLAAPASPSTRPLIGRSSRKTSFCGTRSGPPTSHAPRSGRSCPSSTPASPSNQ